MNKIVNNKQILVGENNNLTYFEFAMQGICRHDQFKTASITIRNREIVESECIGKILF